MKSRQSFLAGPSMAAVLAGSFEHSSPSISFGGAWDGENKPAPKPRKTLAVLHRRTSVYVPHQGKGECARRRRQQAKIEARRQAVAA